MIIINIGFKFVFVFTILRKWTLSLNHDDCDENDHKQTKNRSNQRKNPPLIIMKMKIMNKYEKRFTENHEPMDSTGCGTDGTDDGEDDHHAIDDGSD